MNFHTLVNNDNPIKGGYMKSFIIASLLTLAGMALANTTSGPTQMDDLIRGEMSAVQSYDKIINSVKDKGELRTLRSMREDHAKAVSRLKSHASKDVLEDTETVGPWGTFAKSWVGGAKIFGDKTAMAALKQGEEHGIEEYKEALEDDNVPAEVKRIIRKDLLPKQEAHVKTINRYL